MTVTTFPKMSGNVVGPTDALSPRQHIAIGALLAGKNHGQAAKAAKVDPKTLHRWREDPVFNFALATARDRAFAETVAEVRRVMGAAVATCETLLRPPQKPTVRISAARAVALISAAALRANAEIDVERRLAALEARLGRETP